MPARASAHITWAGEPDRQALVTDESDGGIGVNMALGTAPPLDTSVTVRFLDGHTRQACVRHIWPDAGCIHLGLAWAERLAD